MSYNRSNGGRPLTKKRIKMLSEDKVDYKSNKSKDKVLPKLSSMRDFMKKTREEE